MFVVISYDIPDDARRAKVADVLENFGQRVQKSVFECFLDPPRLQRLVGQLRKLLQDDEDNLRVYHLCESCRPQTEAYGLAKPPQPPQVFIV